MKFVVYIVPCVILFLIGCAKMTEDELWQKVEQSRASGNLDSTIQMCQATIKDYPQGKNASAALYMIAETYQNGKHDYRAAVNYYSAFVKQYPDLNSTPVAMFITAFIYNNNLQMFDSARVAYQNFITRFPNHELAASAKFEIDNLGKTPDEIIDTKKELAVKTKKLSGKK